MEDHQAKRVVLITGGTSGIGKETARLFARHGDHVVITGRDLQELRRTASDIDGIDIVQANVTQAADWERVRTHILETYGTLDILINNAGVGVAIKNLTQQSLEEIERCLNTNLLGPILGIRCFAPLMMEQRKGTIINLSSVCAKHAWEGYAVYAAAKAGVLNLTKSAYAELQPYHIRVTCVIPGAAATSFQVNAQDAPMAEHPDNLLPENVAQVIYNICALPEHVAIEETTVWGLSQVIRPF